MRSAWWLLLTCLSTACMLGCPEEATDDDDDDDSASVEQPTVAAPTGFEGLYVDGGYELRWTDTSDGEASFRLERMANVDAVFAPVTDLDPGTSSYLDVDHVAEDAPIYRLCAVDADTTSDWVELDSSVRYWTYARLIGYDALWGSEGPTRQELVQGHVTYDLAQKAPTATNHNLLLLGDWYGDGGSIYVHAGADGTEIEEHDELNMGDVQT